MGEVDGINRIGRIGIGRIGIGPVGLYGPSAHGAKCTSSVPAAAVVRKGAPTLADLGLAARVIAKVVVFV